MKRFLSLLCAVALVAALFSGCIPSMNLPEEIPATPVVDDRPHLGTDLTVYPLYDTLSEDDKLIWDNICTAIENHSTEWIHIGTYTGVAEAGNAEKRIGYIFRELSYACPDYFWLNLYDYTIHTTETETDTTIELEVKYILDQETAQSYKEAYDAKVNEIVAAAKEIPELFDRVLYVYDTIMAGAEYDTQLAEMDETDHVNLSAYGCLVAGKTVCSGYALAFRSIMDKLDIECGVEFNSYQFYSGWLVGHVWNYCKLDGEYYYFDLTWDDTSLESGPSHFFFAITRDDLSKSSYYLYENSPVPLCTGTKYNYFRYQGLNFEKYDYNAIKSVLQAHRNEESVTLRFDTQAERDRAEKALIEDQAIFDMLPELRSIRWVSPETDLHLVLVLK